MRLFPWTNVIFHRRQHVKDKPKLSKVPLLEEDWSGDLAGIADENVKRIKCQVGEGLHLTPVHSNYLGVPEVLLEL